MVSQLPSRRGIVTEYSGDIFQRFRGNVKTYAKVVTRATNKRKWREVRLNSESHLGGRLVRPSSLMEPPGPHV